MKTEASEISPAQVEKKKKNRSVLDIDFRVSSTANAMDAFVASNLIPFPFSSYFISNPSILKSNKFPPLSQRTTHPFHCRSCRYERVARTDSSRLDHVADSESLDRLVLRGAASAVGAAHGLNVAAAVLVAAAVQKSVIRIKILGVR